MLSGYWLLTDLDGTLISTPHKAHGQYLPLTSSPCYECIQRWLRNGGNVCIVTTADQRVIDQVYMPLREALPDSEASAVGGSATRGSGGGRVMVNMSSSQQSSLSGRQAVESALAGVSTAEQEECGGGRCGKLLLSLYTGAVLYSCGANAVKLVSRYADAVHCATEESVELTNQYSVSMPTAVVVTQDDNNMGHSSGYRREEEVQTTRVCVRGTCIDRNTSDELQVHLKAIYEQYLGDIVRGTPDVVAVLSQMSKRYRVMWRSLLTFLENMYIASTRTTTEPLPPPSYKEEHMDPAILYRGASQSAEAMQWKLGYICSRSGMLAALGILRVEYVEACMDYGDMSSVSQAKRAEAAEADVELVVNHAVQVLREGLPAALRERSAAVTLTFAKHMTALFGTDPKDLKKRLSKRLSNAPATYPDVAQVILLGIPIALFSRYFKKSLCNFVRCGVNAMPQPNSVVFSKLGVSKSTALRYLLGKEQLEDTESMEKGNYACRVNHNRAIALGDNPQSTDYELTVFADLPFISVEKDSQREERHTRIRRRLARAETLEMRGIALHLPDGSAAPTYQDLIERMQRSGSMMDDRLLRHLMYVGGEENGTALFLSELMTLLHVPPLPKKSAPSAHAPMPAVSERNFKKAVEAAAERARSDVYHRTLSQL